MDVLASRTQLLRVGLTLAGGMVLGVPVAALLTMAACSGNSPWLLLAGLGGSAAWCWTYCTRGHTAVRAGVLRFLDRAGLRCRAVVVAGPAGPALLPARSYAAVLDPVLTWAPAPRFRPGRGQPPDAGDCCWDRYRDALLGVARQAGCAAMLIPHGLSDTERNVLEQVCRQWGYELWAAPGAGGGDPAAGGMRPVVFDPRRTVMRVLIKEATDLVTATVLLLLLLPVMAGLALAVRATSPGRVLFWQPRPGRWRRTFAIVKFRTMRGGDDSRPVAAAGIVGKRRDDPRVTPLGRILRRSSLDELPQLWNVVRGEMSLVGPRPMLMAEQDALDTPDNSRRLSVKPGMTGLWQVSGRSDIHSMAERIRIDLDYIDRWSLGLDARICLRTVAAVLSGRGAQ